MSAFDEMKGRAEAIISDHATRDANAERWHQMRNLEWDEWEAFVSSDEGTKAGAKKALDTTPFDVVQGIERLINTSDVAFSVPKEMNLEGTLGDAIEKVAQGIWYWSGKFHGKDIEKVLAGQAATYDECAFVVVKTADEIERLKATGGAATRINNMRRIAATTPYIVRPIEVRGVYPVWDEWGMLSECVIHRSTTAGNVRKRYGPAAESALRKSKKELTDGSAVDLYEMWDDVNKGIWMRQIDKPVIFEEHGMDFIPIVCKLVEGSKLESSPHDQRRGLLYGLDKSGIWKAKNILLSSNITNMFLFGLVVNLIHYQSQYKQSRVEVDVRDLLNVIEVPAGDRLEQADLRVVNPQALELYSRLEDMGIRTTVYPQAFGAPLGREATYSETALLTSAGRLPLTGLKEQVAGACADGMQMIFDWMRQDKGVYEGRAKNAELFKLKASEIPEFLVLTANLEVSMPMEWLQNAPIFNQLKNDFPHEWLIEQLFNVKQPKQLILDAASESLFREDVAGMAMEKRAAAQARANQIMREAEFQSQQAMQNVQAQQAAAQQAQMMQQGAGMPPEMAGVMERAEGGGAMEAPPVQAVAGPMAPGEEE